MLGAYIYLQWLYVLELIPWSLSSFLFISCNSLHFKVYFLLYECCYSSQELTHWKRPWCWEGLGAGGEGDDRGWDGWMASPTWWTWVWVNSRSWWWTGRPGVLRFMGSQRVGHDWVTELNWTELQFSFSFFVSPQQIKVSKCPLFLDSQSPHNFPVFPCCGAQAWVLLYSLLYCLSQESLWLHYIHFYLM